LFNWSIYF